MGHSFLYSQNYMFSRNALFWKVTGSKKLTIKTSHIWDISDPSESRSLKLYLVNYQRTKEISMIRKKLLSLSRLLRIPGVLILNNYVTRLASMRKQGWLWTHCGRCGSRNYSFRKPRYDCWQAPYSVDTFFFIGATLVSYLLLKVLMKIYIQTLPKALRTQALTTLTSNFGFGRFGPVCLVG